MALTLVVEDGTGLSNANAYLTVAEVDIRLDKHKELTCWTALSPDEKPYALASATDYIDFNFRFYGSVLKATQALQWPRTKNFNTKGILLAQGIIPEELKEATAILALEWGRISTGLISRSESSGSLKQYSADSLAVAFDTSSSSELTMDQKLMGTRFTFVELMLRSIAERKGSEWLSDKKLTIRAAL